MESARQGITSRGWKSRVRGGLGWPLAPNFNASE